jgi:hypothetical protein
MVWIISTLPEEQQVAEDWYSWRSRGQLPFLALGWSAFSNWGEDLADDEEERYQAYPYGHEGRSDWMCFGRCEYLCVD